VHPQTGELYATTGGDGTKPGYLYRIDTASGATTAIGQSDRDGVMALTFRASDATLWGWVEGEGLIQISLSDGKATLALRKDLKIEGMAWAPNGKLYLARDRSLYEYNPATKKFVTYASNLPRGTESLDILPDGRLVGGARGSTITLFSYDLTSKKVISSKTLNGSSGYTLRSIEGLAWPATASVPPGF
jgi:WD40 repeat protein